jgi:thiol:disulfide interchange protein
MKTLPLLSICLALLLGTTSAQALEIRPYSPDALAAARKAGGPVALHFHASWCPTCRAQEKVFNDFKPDASLALPLLVVDYDKERALKQKLGVRTQSTVIVYRCDNETARVAGEKYQSKLKSSMQSSL